MKSYFGKYTDCFIRYSVWLLVTVLAGLSLWASVSVSLGFVPLFIILAAGFVQGLFDLFQQEHTLRRNYPLVAHLRWMLEDLRPYLRQYIVESNQSGKPYPRDKRALIYARAKGDEDYHPFGTELDVYDEKHEWLSQSIRPVEIKDGDTLRVQVGSSQCQQPYSASVLNISAMSFGSLSARAIEALNLGAKHGGFYHDTGEGAISSYHQKHGGDLVWELGTGYFGCRQTNGKFDPVQFKERARCDQVKMIEIKISQGAKPGHGGILPKEKITAEISKTRGVPQGEDCVSPPYHTAFSTPIEMMEWVAELRELSGGKPVGIKLCVGQPHEVMAIMKAMRETEIYLDFIVVDGTEGGTGAAPLEFSDHLGMPLREGLITVRNCLVGAGLKSEVKLAASGKVSGAFTIASNCAIGADWCNAARAFMFTVGCVMSMKCHTDKCPTGVATQDEARQRGLVVEEKSQRVTRYHKETLHTLKEFIAAAGCHHTSELTPSMIYHRVNPVEIKTINELYPFLEEGELLEDCRHEQYAKWWRQASGGAFSGECVVKPHTTPVSLIKARWFCAVICLG